MKGFSEFLTEGRDAPLYHSTGEMAAENIIKSNTLLRGPAMPSHWPTKDQKHISLTRSYQFAMKWMDEMGATSRPVVFELDQRLLTQNYKVVAFNYFNGSFARIPMYSNMKHHHWMNQFEEAVTSDIKNIDKYIVKVIIPSYNKSYNKTVRNHPKLFLWDTKEFVNSQYSQAAE